jgi:hypothetical protein
MTARRARPVDHRAALGHDLRLPEIALPATGR